MKKMPPSLVLPPPPPPPISYPTHSPCPLIGINLITKLELATNKTNPFPLPKHRLGAICPISVVYIYSVIFSYQFHANLIFGNNIS